MLVGSHDRAVDQLQGLGRALRQRLENLQPHARLGPAVEPIVGRRVWPIALRQVPPRRAGTQDEENTVQNPPIILPRHAPGLVRQHRCDQQPLPIRQIKASHLPNSHRLEDSITSRPLRESLYEYRTKSPYCSALASAMI